jgi:membrane protease YdiL (CAAX protease family)
LWGSAIPIVAGLAALVGRTVGQEALIVTAGVGAAGGLAPIAYTRRHRNSVHWLVVVALGTAPFLLVSLSFQSPAAQWGRIAIAGSVLTAIAEELFFRRLLYGWLERWGPTVAILGSASAFAAVHLQGWGYELLPINLAAGIIFAWQRRATGSWSAAAVSHALANLMAMGLIV